MQQDQEKLASDRKAQQVEEAQGKASNKRMSNGFPYLTFFSSRKGTSVKV